MKIADCFFFKFSVETCPFLGHVCSSHNVSSGFKATVASFICTWQRHETCLWCNTFAGVYCIAASCFPHLSVSAEIRCRTQMKDQIANYLSLTISIVSDNLKILQINLFQSIEIQDGQILMTKIGLK